MSSQPFPENALARIATKYALRYQDDGHLYFVVSAPGRPARRSSRAIYAPQAIRARHHGDSPHRGQIVEPRFPLPLLRALFSERLLGWRLCDGLPFLVTDAPWLPTHCGHRFTRKRAATIRNSVTRRSSDGEKRLVAPLEAGTQHEPAKHAERPLAEKGGNRKLAQN